MYCKWGILGPGFISTRAIIPAIQETSNSLTIAVASSNKQRAREVAQRFGIERFYAGYQALLDDPDIDVVYIALPNHLHREWTIRAAEAGKHVLCEKPLAMNADECKEMITACDQANAVADGGCDVPLPSSHALSEADAGCTRSWRCAIFTCGFFF